MKNWDISMANGTPLAAKTAGVKPGISKEILKGEDNKVYTITGPEMLSEAELFERIGPLRDN